ncbi:MspA family porin [Nocardia farcinica]|nr:MspA family porin [Nocardia farcinica]MBA4854358.1 MspA family porin [Nocardia farcinica]MBC9814543.1 MspA family porin [Nocardia farcinica]MBF6070773.1 MspA family porin [Nocardia farcinica]MBF6230543.1 MspA family porin [Nocardia farcinica]MBF6249393.1 MspA family porin [Nocardia farcinica]
MKRTHVSIMAAIGAVTVTAIGSAAPAAGTAPGEVAAGAARMVAAVDFAQVVPAGDTAFGVPFVHAVKVSGDFSVALDGVSALRGGEVAAGYLVGCAVDVSDGISVAIAPEVGMSASISPSIGADFGVDLGLSVDAPPEVGIGFGVGVGLEPSIGVEGAVAGELSLSLAPGTVTAVPIGVAELDEESTFPFTFAHANTPLHVNGCLSPASAMPFITVRADTPGSTLQTTGYGDPFTF